MAFQNRLTVGKILFHFPRDDSFLNVGLYFTENFFMALYGNMECVEKAFGCVKIEYDSLGDINRFLVLSHWLRIHSEIND